MIGAQFGTIFGAKLRGEQLRVILGLIVLAVGAKVAWTLVVTPLEFFTLGAGVS